MRIGTACSSALPGGARLLRNPEYDVPVSLEDCRELAEAEGLTDPWGHRGALCSVNVARRFRIDDPVLWIDLDPVQTQKLHRLVTGLDTRCSRPRTALAGLTSSGARRRRCRQQVGGEDRGGRAARRHAAVHRALHGALPAAQHARGLVGGQGAGGPNPGWRKPQRTRTSCGRLFATRLQLRHAALRA